MDKHCGCKGIPITWYITSGGCKRQISHALNHDGYFRKRVNGELKMMHVLAWEKDRGKSCPKAKEIHHECGVRGCCNPRHLKAVNQCSHVARHNNQRGVRRKWAAHKYWLLTGVTGIGLSQVFNVSFSISCRWIRYWKVN